jgi:hypothetical protein
MKRNTGALVLLLAATMSIACRATRGSAPEAAPGGKTSTSVVSPPTAPTISAAPARAEEIEPGSELSLDRLTFETRGIGSGATGYPTVTLGTNDEPVIALTRLGEHGTSVLRGRDPARELVYSVSEIRADAKGVVYTAGSDFDIYDRPIQYKKVFGTLDDQTPTTVETCNTTEHTILRVAPDGSAVAAYSCDRLGIRIVRNSPWRVVATAPGWRAISVALDAKTHAAYVASDGHPEDSLQRVIAGKAAPIALPGPGWDLRDVSVAADGTLWLLAVRRGDSAYEMVAVRRVGDRWSRPIVLNVKIAERILPQSRGGVLIIGSDERTMQILRIDASGVQTSIPFPEWRSSLSDAALDKHGRLHIVYTVQGAHQTSAYAIGQARR